MCLFVQRPDGRLHPEVETPSGKKQTLKRGRAVFHLPSISLFPRSPPVPPSWKGSGLPQLLCHIKTKRSKAATRSREEEERGRRVKIKETMGTGEAKSRERRGDR